MEVHPPHEPVHGWRDFAIHLIIVTIGLCIALSLEALVERAHHHHLVREARENIRKELKINDESAQRNRELIRANVARQQNNVRSIRALMEHGKEFHGSVNNTFDINSMNDSAWRTAHETGALSYMPYDEVQRYADLYDLQDFITKQTEAAAIRDFQAAAPFQTGYDASNLPQADYAWLLHENAAVQILLQTLDQLNEQYDQAVVNELKQH